MRVRKAAIGASALVAIATATCACSPGDDTEPREPAIIVQSTQFAPPPAPITDLVPTAEQLTALYNATTNYSIREEDRARLLEGPSDQTTLRIARAWGAQPSSQYIQFTTVEPVGPDMINTTGQGRVEGMEPYPVGPIPFVRSNAASLPDNGVETRSPL
ncbi:hypothetical protein CBI38_29330 [Rhodococcus oxybenzonivorans]|uniref:Low molecular weight antigen MTB12-like C-terminal domain-containing protein n=1 Tax=Rhodococcus oxybenzonivorans TaxID=1990687 RepID=A0A2S2C2C3_9NOCA|nr:hypothetical protein [Rhodococcus oxybenzonivorans]AWK75046.1 hypothetical protein CBI38_29330 [Rhodococcus oxybenzonivorans]